MLEMGVTSPIYPTRLCQQNLAATTCKTAARTTAGATEQYLQKVTQYAELIGVPA